MFNRRTFLTVSAAGAAGACVATPGPPPGRPAATVQAATSPKDLSTRLAEAETSTVLRRHLVGAPVIIDTVEVLKVEKDYFVRVRDRDGAEGVSMANANHMTGVWPLFLDRVAPSYLGRDARDLEAIQAENYVHDLNYKWQGLAYWCCVAWLEFAVLDLLGRKSGRSVGDLLGGRIREASGIYYASGKRGNEPEAEVAHLQELIDQSGAQAVKFRLGARMAYTDASTARDVALIPLARKRLGDDRVLYVDANSSYDVPLAIRIGRLLEEHRYNFYEEPVKFDHYEETLEVARALSIPIAFGEQEVSLRRFRWLVETDAAQVIQPDLLFNGGLIRAIRVARMAEARGYPCVPHMSGGGMGSLYVLHFASCVANTTPYQEYKGLEKVPHEVTGTGQRLAPAMGVTRIPSGPGLGVTFDPDYLAKARSLSL